MKIVINKCYGGFGLSYEATKMYLARKGKECFCYAQTKYNFRDGYEQYELIEEDTVGVLFYCYTEYLGDVVKGWPKAELFMEKEIPRDDKDLVFVVKKLGEEASGNCANLDIVKIPKGTNWIIENNDGLEHIVEKNHIWY